jgi:hypothetical protein
MESNTIRPDLLRFLLELKNRQLINAGKWNPAWNAP